MLPLFAVTALDEINVCHVEAAGAKLAVMCFVRWIIDNKDFFLAISALVLSPLAAVFVGLKAAKRQANAVIESTKLQVRSASLRDVRQRSLENLRDECAAQIYAMAELKKQIYSSILCKAHPGV